MDNGITTTWLDAYGLPLSNDATRQDTDGDGQQNWEEHEAGMDPTDAHSVFRLEYSVIVAGEFALNWQAVDGKSYAVDYKADLTDLLWTKIATGVAGVVPTTQFPIVLDLEQTSGFFRVRVE